MMTLYFRTIVFTCVVRPGLGMTRVLLVLLVLLVLVLVLLPGIFL
jgi:hypothetical protein